MSGGGTKRTKSTQTYTPAPWIEQSAQQANQLASQYAGQEYERYGEDRVAPLSENERQGIDLARFSSGEWRDDLGTGRTELEGVSTDFRDADMEGYMNPYIKSALDPTAREIRQEGQRRQQQLAGSLTARGAFSGRRAQLASLEERELTQQSISDLYGRGYGEAFDRGAALWQSDQERRLAKSAQFMEMAGLGSDLIDADYQRLMDSGETQRFVDQQMKDFDYQQFIEQRDWSGRQAAYLTDVLRGLKGSYTETQVKVNEEKKKGNVWGTVLGIIGAAVGGYFGGMQGAQAGGALGSGIGGAIDEDSDEGEI